MELFLNNSVCFSLKLRKICKKICSREQQGKKECENKILKAFLPDLNSIQDLGCSFEQIADVPQNRGCLSWDGVEERGDRYRESLEKRGRGEEQEKRCLGTASQDKNDSFGR